MLTVSLLFYMWGNWLVKWIEVCDRERSQQYVSSMPWAAISVAEDKNWSHLKTMNRTGLLQLFFKDCKNCDDLNHAFLFGGLFTRQHAEQIFSFVDRHWSNVDSFLIQCDSGERIAPAISAAIMYTRYGSEADDWYFDNLNPNIIVYRTMLLEYQKFFFRQYKN